MSINLSLANYRSIAKVCGVGKTTVGRVLKNSGYVSEDVRQRVLEAANHLGYQPDPALGALARRRWPNGSNPKTATIAYIHHGVLTDTIMAPPDLQGVRNRAKELGYVVDTFSLKEYSSLSSLNRVLYSRGIQGVLVRAFRDNIHLDLEWRHFFTVFIGAENHQARVHNVQSDFSSALQHAVHICRDRGYRRIGMALMNHAASGTNIPFQAQALYERFRLEQDMGQQPQILTYEPTKDFAQAFYRWFREARPDVVVSTNIQPYYWLTSAHHYDRRQKERKIPEDVAMLCTRSCLDTPQIAQMDLRENELGKQAVDLMHHQLQHGSIGKPTIPFRILIPPIFIDGKSLPTMQGCDSHKR